MKKLSIILILILIFFNTQIFAAIRSYYGAPGYYAYPGVGMYPYPTGMMGPQPPVYVAPSRGFPYTRPVTPAMTTMPVASATTVVAPMTTPVAPSATVVAAPPATVVAPATTTTTVVAPASPATVVPETTLVEPAMTEVIPPGMVKYIEPPTSEIDQSSTRAYYRPAPSMQSCPPNGFSQMYLPDEEYRYSDDIGYEI